MEIFEKILELKKSNQSFIIASVVKTAGSVPGKVGFKMIIKSERKTFGTVGGGAIEGRSIIDALSFLEKNESGLKEYTLSSDPKLKDDEGVVPMMCNGKVWIYYETYDRRPSVYIFGGGHVGKSLLYYLKPLDYHKILIDNRPEFSEKSNYPEADECITSDYLEYVKNFEPAEGSYFIALTHGHKFDYEVLATICKRSINYSYIGVIASKSKAAELLAKLKSETDGNIDLAKIHTPIGLKIGGDSADEIALSIAAQLQAVRYEKPIQIASQ